MSNKEKVNQIRVDMDHLSSPVWFSQDGKSFINGDLCELDISESLSIWLSFYQNLWEIEVGKYEFDENHKSDITGIVEALRLSLAKRLKKELPACCICVWDEETSTNKFV
jgi:hypothetical protein